MPNPYIVGSPVTANRFYGREEFLAEVLTVESPRNSFCYFASRRFGKTSFLRELEWRCDEENLPYLPVYWDFQGTRTERDLSTQLLRSMFGPASRRRFDAVGLDLAQLRSQSLLLDDLTLELHKAARDNGKKLLFLCDECENLIPMAESDPALLGRLRGIMQQDGVRTVLAGSRRLAELNHIKLWGSSFLNGWKPFVFLPRLQADEARALIQQEKTADGLNLPSEMVEDILEKTNCHPYLIQAVCSQLWDLTPDSASLETIYLQAYQEFSNNAFVDDYRYLSQAEQIVVQKVANEKPVPEGNETERLEGAGYISRDGGGWQLSSWFFNRWLQDNKSRLGQLQSVVSDQALQGLYHPETEATKTGELSVLDDWLNTATAATLTPSFERWAGGTEATLALIFTDIVGSTVLGNELGNQGMQTVRQAHFRQARALIKKHGGYEIKTIGDAFMVAFRTATAALDFALELYAQTGDHRLLIRAGIHVGQLFIENDDAFGIMVNYAARLGDQAQGAEIWLSDRAHVDIQEARIQAHQALNWQKHANSVVKSFAGLRLLWSIATRETLHLPSGTPVDSAAAILAEKIAKGAFDVFLCHNSADKVAVKEIGLQLKQIGILPWLDEWELRPGMPWQNALEQQIESINSAAVFIGKKGLGPWQDIEQAAFIREFIKRKCLVIPVILRSSPRKVVLPILLQSMVSVDFRKSDPDPLKQLVYGITGERLP